MAKTVNKKKTAAKSGKTTTAKTPAKKPVVKKPAAKTVAKKPAPKKPVAQKPTVKTTTAIKTPVKSAKDVKTAKPANDMTKDVAKGKVAAPKQTAKQADVKQTATAVPATATKQAAKNDNTTQIKLEFKAGDKVVYPAHGVGRVEGIEKLVAAGMDVTLYTITFEKDRMRLKLPLQKVATSGLRPLANKEQLAEVYSTMKGRARIRRVMWSRRAQEYEAKINSGSPVQVAEVLRDLKRNVSSTEHSYSERQIFQQALERLASELAAIENVTQEVAAEKLQNLLVEA